MFSHKNTTREHKKTPNIFIETNGQFYICTIPVLPLHLSTPLTRYTKELHDLMEIGLISDVHANRGRRHGGLRLLAGLLHVRWSSCALGAALQWQAIDVG